MSRAANQACLAAHLAAERHHDMTATLATLHPDCLFVDEPLRLQLTGHDGARRHYHLWWSAFAAVPETGELHWVDDDLAVGRSAFSGSHAGAFAGLAATGRPVRVPFVVFVRFRDGLLAGEHFTYDLNGLLLQIGAPAFDPGAASIPAGGGR
jgi:predicted ester cyclase